jgi:hypothetical protein
MKKIVFVIALLAGYATVNAQGTGATASATATAVIVSPITITKTVDLDFGNVAVDALTGGTVVLDPTTATRTVTGGVTLPAVTGTVTAASFTVAGEAGYTYDIFLPTTPLTIDDGASNSMTVDQFISDPATSGTLSATAPGSQTLNVGATLNVSAAQAAGTYTSATPFDVTVNYN